MPAGQPNQWDVNSFEKCSGSPIRSVQFRYSVVSNFLRPHELQHTRPPCPSPTPRVHPNPCLLSQWCHPTISSSVVPFSSRLQSFPASGSFPMSQLFTSGGQSIGVSASTSVLPISRETQIKTIMKCHLIPVRTAIIKNKKENSKCWRWCGEKGTFPPCW